MKNDRIVAAVFAAASVLPFSVRSAATVKIARIFRRSGTDRFHQIVTAKLKRWQPLNHASLA
ncbi:hypothetical protein KCP75_23140 [Salmonella enterica subsp. enterica]|nr:hypothetical protein KCP75_23140 [Salmonella enterica subsp. enterica]